jgi:ACT domain-containing protein
VSVLHTDGRGFKSLLAYERKRKTVRPYKLTEEIQGLITVALSDGCTRTAAFGSAGISRDTFYKWMKDVPEFMTAVEDAEADARMRIESRLVKLALDGDKFALMYYLQNRYPDD